MGRRIAFWASPHRWKSRWGLVRGCSWRTPSPRASQLYGDRDFCASTLVSPPHTLARLECGNGKVVQGDGVQLFHDRLVHGSVEAVHVYFPDPSWKLHRKRRVMHVGRRPTCAASGRQHALLDRCARVLRHHARIDSADDSARRTDDYRGAPANTTWITERTSSGGCVCRTCRSTVPNSASDRPAIHLLQFDVSSRFRRSPSGSCCAFSKHTW